MDSPTDSETNKLQANANDVDQIGMVKHTSIAAASIKPDTSETGGESTPVSSGFADFTRKVERLAKVQAMADRPPLRIGAYEIQGQIGEGGQAVVFRGWDTRLERLVAIKVPHLQHVANAHAAKRFVREGRSLGQLRHEGIVSVHHADEDETTGIPYLVLDFCSDGNLDNWLKKNGKVEPRVAATWTLQMAKAVEHAHEQGVLHRDIKPSNIFLEKRAEESGDDLGYRLKLGDFGLAKILNHAPGEGSTFTKDRLGTLGYASPEQVLGQNNKLNETTDIYSLGVLLFELLTGKLPFEQTISQLIQDPPSLRSQRRTVSADLEAICHKCLAVKQEQRYASATELANDLERYLRGERTLERPIGLMGHALKRASRNKAVSLLSMAGLALLFTLIFLLSREERSVTAHQEWKADCNEVWTLAFTPDSQYLLVAGDTGTEDAKVPVIEKVSVFDVVKGRKMTSLNTLHDAMIRKMVLADNGNTLITSGYDGKVAEYDWKSGRLLKAAWRLPEAFSENHQKPGSQEISSLSVSKDGQWVAVGTRVNGPVHSRIAVFRRNSEEDYILQKASHCNISNLYFAEPGAKPSLLFTSSIKDGLYRWDVGQQEIVTVLKLPHSIDGFDITQSANKIVFALSDHTIRIFEWPSLQPFSEWTGHDVEIQRVAFSPDGRLLASADSSGMVILWKLARNGVTELLRKPLPVRVSALAFSPDGQKLVAGRLDGKVNIFPVAFTQQ
jgi:serine/threonine protein kinase